MTVAELIEFLKTQRQDMQVIYAEHSEFNLLELKDIYEVQACEPRPDGWVARKRDDKPTQTYLLV